MDIILYLGLVGAILFAALIYCEVQDMRSQNPRMDREARVVYLLKTDSGKTRLTSVSGPLPLSSLATSLWLFWRVVGRPALSLTKFQETEGTIILMLALTESRQTPNERVYFDGPKRCVINLN